METYQVQTCDQDALKWAQESLAKGDDLEPDRFPHLGNISAAHFFTFIPRPKKVISPEFAYVPLPARGSDNNERFWRAHNLVAEWNMAWEAAQIRPDFFGQMGALSPDLAWLTNYASHNLYLLPGRPSPRYWSCAVLHHLLPRRTLERFRLPLLRRGLWPYYTDVPHIDPLLPADYEENLSQAFAFHIWPLLDSGSKLPSYRKDDSLRVLAHNLDYWIPYAYEVASEYARQLGRSSFDNNKQAMKLSALRKALPDDILADRPLMGGTLWMGEAEAWDATKAIVQRADDRGRLRAIIDTIRSNRVEEDFSACWSRAREDFERKLYHKRAKVKISFIELDETIPVHGPEAEIHEHLLWQDFLAFLDTKEKAIVVLLRNGETKLKDISQKLGYANHSPVSKALRRIRDKARKFLQS